MGPLPGEISRFSTPGPGFQKLGVKPGLGPNLGASCERPNLGASCERVDPPHLIVITSAQDLSVLRVHQMRLGARKARHL
jgi:hypothetical protein